MGHIEATKHLAASPDALWAKVSDLTHWGDWFTVHEKWLQDPPTALTPGTTLVAKIVMLGMANKIEWRVDEVEAPKRMVMSGTGLAGVKCQFEFTVTPSGAGSDFTVTGDFEGAMIKGALGKAVEKDGARQLDKSLQRLEELAAA